MGRPRLVICARPAPLLPSSILFLPSVSSKKYIGFTVDVSCCVYQRFGKCRMGMYSVRYVLRFHVHSNRKGGFSNDFACMWCDNESSHYYSIFLKNLEDSLCITHTICLCTCSKRKFSALSLQLPNEGDLWICKDARRYSVVVHLALSAHYV